ncbi:MAG: hypothetical protein RLZZ384_423, partial [Pseudomonadota bacterium]
MSKCAAIQMASSPNISANLLEAEKLIAEAVKSGAKLVALPENFALMGNNELDKVHAKEADGLGIIQNFLETTAKKYAVWIKDDDWLIVKLKIAAYPYLKEFFESSKAARKGNKGIGEIFYLRLSGAHGINDNEFIAIVVGKFNIHQLLRND